jgi:hypothetical protein
MFCAQIKVTAPAEKKHRRDSAHDVDGVDHRQHDLRKLECLPVDYVKRGRQCAEDVANTNSARRHPHRSAPLQLATGARYRLPHRRFAQSPAAALHWRFDGLLEVMAVRIHRLRRTPPVADPFCLRVPASDIWFSDLLLAALS